MGRDKKHIGLVKVRPISIEELYKHIKDVKVRICIDKDGNVKC